MKIAEIKQINENLNVLDLKKIKYITGKPLPRTLTLIPSKLRLPHCGMYLISWLPITADDIFLLQQTSIKFLQLFVSGLSILKINYKYKHLVPMYNKFEDV